MGLEDRDCSSIARHVSPVTRHAKSSHAAPNASTVLASVARKYTATGFQPTFVNSPKARWLMIRRSRGSPGHLPDEPHNHETDQTQPDQNRQPVFVHALKLPAISHQL